jgi:hypothetical protein
VEAGRGWGDCGIGVRGREMLIHRLGRTDTRGKGEGAT